MRVLAASLLALAATACGPMFDSPLAPEPTPWVLPSPGPSPCPSGSVVSRPARLGTPVTCIPVVGVAQR